MDRIKTPVSRVGNKSNLLGIIYALFPLHYERYIEPFGGSGSVLLGKPWQDNFEVINDYNGNLVNLFRCMRDRPLAFIRELGFLSLNARDDFKVLKRFFRKEEFDDPFLEEEMELTKILLPEPSDAELRELMQTSKKDYDLRRAAMYLKLIRYSYSSGGKSFACQPFSLRSLFGLIEEFSKRVENVVIENQDFEVLIRHYDRPGGFIYCDPPYFSSEYVYDCEFTWEDHLRLHKTLVEAKSKFLVSYNDCPKIRELYAGFPRFEFARPHSMAQRYEAGREFRELLIGNYDLLARARDAPWQVTMEELNNENFDFEQMLKESVYHGK